jgi:hypothetical protein
VSFHASGTTSIIKSNNGVISFFSSVNSLIAIQSFHIAYIIGNSSCSSVAHNLANKSKAISCTSSGLAAGLSILLIITIGFNHNSNDFLSTNFV